MRSTHEVLTELQALRVQRDACTAMSRPRDMLDQRITALVWVLEMGEIDCLSLPDTALVLLDSVG